ncbi:MAG: hypothetical protein ABH854_00055 [Candidatus Diapherotrites archaeon]|nr:hypothetical protein [Candidatus Micrarchaeota archaeon]MBU1939905.1 hypothetical protein [Candidatus Micrarchaeota archaeon]
MPLPVPKFKNRFRVPRKTKSVLNMPLRDVKPNFWQHGKKFLRNFRSHFYKINGRTYLVDLKGSIWESPYSITVSYYDPKKKEGVYLFDGRIAFKENTVVVKALQGWTGVSSDIRAFEKEAKMPMANFVCSVIEAEAKRLGYKAVHIMRPEKNRWFQTPTLYREVSKTARGKSLYEKWESGELKESEEKELARLKETAKENIQQRMKKITNGAAEARGYKPLKNFFRKKLAE